MRSIQINDDPSNNDHVVFKKYVVDEFLTKTHSSVVRNSRKIDFNDNIITNVKSIQINDLPTKDNDVKNKKYIDDELDKNTILRINDNSNDRY